MTVLLKRINVPDDEITELTEQINDRRYNEMFPRWNNYDVQETRRIAREETKIETAKRLLLEGLSVELIARATLLTVDEVSALQENASLVSENTPEYQNT